MKDNHELVRGVSDLMVNSELLKTKKKLYYYKTVPGDKILGA